MPINCALDLTNGQIVLETEDRAGLPIALRRQSPQIAQRMLHEGQLVSLTRQTLQLRGLGVRIPRSEAREVIEKPGDETRLDPEADHARWPLDGLPALLPCHAPRQVERAIDLLRQSRDQRACAEILRAHGDDDMDAGI